MRALSDAIYARLVGDAALTALLGTWEGNPSIIAFRPVPEDAGMPMVLSSTTATDNDSDGLNFEERTIRRDIAIYANASVEGFDAVEAGAEIIRNLFHRQPLAVAGWNAFSITAQGPIDAPTDAGEIGRIVTLTVGLSRN